MMTAFMLRPALVLSLGLGLTACLPGTVLGKRATCVGSAALITQVSGDCARTLERLSDTDTQTIVIETVDVAPLATVDYLVSVETGKVRATFTDADGEQEIAEAMPGDPARGSVRVRLDPLNQFKFDLTPVEGEASGVSYQVHFVCDCMP